MISQEIAQQEVWRWVVGAEGRYQVSSLGRIRSLVTRGKTIKAFTYTKGYANVGMARSPGRQTRERVHRLVARAFLGPEPAGMSVNHKNGNKSDNRVENLEYMTIGDNVRHARDAGLMRQGERTPWSKLTEDQVREIRQSKESYRAQARKLGVSASTVRRAALGLYWSCVDTEARAINATGR